MHDFYIFLFHNLISLHAYQCKATVRCIRQSLSTFYCALFNFISFRFFSRLSFPPYTPTNSSPCVQYFNAVSDLQFACMKECLNGCV